MICLKYKELFYNCRFCHVYLYPFYTAFSWLDWLPLLQLAFCLRVTMIEWRFILVLPINYKGMLYQCQIEICVKGVSQQGRRKGQHCDILMTCSVCTLRRFISS